MRHHQNAATERAAVFETVGVGVRNGRGKIFAITRETGSQSQRARDAERNLLLAVDKYDVAYAKLKEQAVDDETRRMLEEWKNAEQRKLRQQAREARELVNADRAGTENTRSKLLALPAIAPGDAAGALRDRETRERFAGLPEAQQRRLLEEIKGGSHTELMLSLARDVIETPQSQFAVGLWTQRMQREHADELAALDEQDAGANAILTSITSLESVIEA